MDCIFCVYVTFVKRFQWFFSCWSGGTSVRVIFKFEKKIVPLNSVQLEDDFYIK